MWTRFIAILAVVAGAWGLLRDPPWVTAPDIVPRLVSPSGELAPAEETVIALFEAPHRGEHGYIQPLGIVRRDRLRRACRHCEPGRAPAHADGNLPPVALAEPR